MPGGAPPAVGFGKKPLQPLSYDQYSDIVQDYRYGSLSAGNTCEPCGFQPEGELVATHREREREPRCSGSNQWMFFTGRFRRLAAICSRDKTNDIVFTAGEAAKELSPASWLEFKWLARARGSILHDNDVVIFGERRCVLAIVTNGLEVVSAWMSNSGPPGFEVILVFLASGQENQKRYCLNSFISTRIFFILPKKKKDNCVLVSFLQAKDDFTVWLYFPVIYRGNQFTFEVQHCSDLFEVNNNKIVWMCPTQRQTGLPLLILTMVDGDQLALGWTHLSSDFWGKQQY